MDNRGEARGSLRGGRFCMNRGRARGNPRGGRNSPDGRPPHRHSPEWRPSGKKDTLRRDVSNHSEHKPTFSSEYQQEWPPSGKRDTFSHAERLKEGQNLNESVGVDSKELKCLVASVSRHEWPPSGKRDTFSHAEGLKEGQNLNESVGVDSKELKCLVASVSRHEGHLPSLSTMNHSGNFHMGIERMKIGETPNKMKMNIETSPPCKPDAGNGPVSVASPLSTTGPPQKPELPEQSTALSTFDLCPTKAGSTITLKAPLLVQNRERRNEIKRSMEQTNGSVLQSGMVLLKSFISLNDQVNIVKLCRNLGLGPGGFYQPGYRDGAKLNLKMMCLGKNWDPETNNYGDHRPIDGAKPPTIPKDFFQLVESAIKESLSLIRKDSKATNSERILPWMSPDICLVNFYSSSGRLGLHQDRDESEESLHKGLPVVSFSIGDTAEFLYGDQRDIEKANKVFLESGDVLMFGGKSRHVFHGVASIQPNTAPKTLLEKTNLRPGRLNLTFRQY